MWTPRDRAQSAAAAAATRRSCRALHADCCSPCCRTWQSASVARRSGGTLPPASCPPTPTCPPCPACPASRHWCLSLPRLVCEAVQLCCAHLLPILVVCLSIPNSWRTNHHPHLQARATRLITCVACGSFCCGRACRPTRWLACAPPCLGWAIRGEWAGGRGRWAGRCLAGGAACGGCPRRRCGACLLVCLPVICAPRASPDIPSLPPALQLSQIQCRCKEALSPDGGVGCPHAAAGETGACRYGVGWVLPACLPAAGLSWRALIRPVNRRRLPSLCLHLPPDQHVCACSWG